MDILFPVLERARRLLEEMDAVQMAAVRSHQSLLKIKSPRECLKVEHFIRNAINHVLGLNGTLKSHLLDHQEELQREKEALDARTDLSVFYGKVKQLKEYHKRLSNEPADIQAMERVTESLRVSDEQLEYMFSGEECLGRFLDLNSLYIDFVNLKKGSVPNKDYLGYLRSFGDFPEL